MVGMPLISVVLPVHNGAAFLDEAIQSVVTQTHADWELILVDDGSTDQSPELIQRWVARDERIRAIVLAANGGLPRALNKGFGSAAGEFLTWTSHDNRYHPEALARMLAELTARPEVAVVYAPMILIDNDGRALGTMAVSGPEGLAFANCVLGCFLYRREVQERLGGYNENLVLVEDYDFWLRASCQFKLAPLDEPLYDYRVHDQSLTAKYPGEVAVKIDQALALWLRKVRWIGPEVRDTVYKRLLSNACNRRDGARLRRYAMDAMWYGRRPFLFPGYRAFLFDVLLGSRIGGSLRSLRVRCLPRLSRDEND